MKARVEWLSGIEIKPFIVCWSNEKLYKSYSNPNHIIILNDNM